jgi:hypothetical protein
MMHYRGGVQQGMQICNRILWRGRLRRRVAATWFLTNRCSGTVAGACSRELANLTKHRWCRFICNAPILGRSPEATYQHDGRRPCAAALQIHLATATDVDQSREVRASRTISAHHVERGKKRNKEQGDASGESHGAVMARWKSPVVSNANDVRLFGNFTDRAPKYRCRCCCGQWCCFEAPQHR